MHGNASIAGARTAATDGTATTARPPAALVASFVLALAEAVVAASLTRIHFDMGALSCGIGDCHAVQSSPCVAIGPVPIALLGLAMFLAIATLAVARWRRPAPRWPAPLAACPLVFASILSSSTPPGWNSP